MSIRIVGKLRNPLGNPIAGAVIRFTAITSEGGIVTKGTESVRMTTAGGDYAFNVEYGRYLIEVLYTDEYHESGEVILNERTLTPISLTELIQFGLPHYPPLLAESPANWPQLLQGTIDNDEWDKDNEDQIRWDTSLVNEKKSLHKDGEAYLSRENLTSSTSDSHAEREVLTYTDEYAQDAALITDSVSVPDAVSKTSLEVYSESNGKVSASKETTVQTNTGSVVESFHVDDLITKHTSSLVQGGLVSTLGSSIKDATGLIEATLTQSTVLNKTVDNITHNATIADTHSIYYDYLSAAPTVTLTQEVSSGSVKSLRTISVEDGLSSESISVDNYQVRDDAGFPVLEVDTINKEVTLNARLRINNPDDFKGEDGWSYDHDLQWGNNGQSSDSADWFEDYQPSYQWQRSRKFKFIEGKLLETKVYVEPWGTPIRLNAIDGVDGDQYWIKYEYSITTNGPWVAAHLYDAAVHEWRRYIYVINGSYITDQTSELYGPFNGWFKEQIKGINGDQGEITLEQYRYSRNGGIPDLEGEDPWHSNLVTTDYYRSGRLAYFRTTNDLPDEGVPASWPYGYPYKTSVWGSPIKIKPKAGVDYGDKFVAVMLYKRFTPPIGDPTAVPSGLIGTMVYDFTNLTLLPENALVDSLNGWSQEIPDGSGDIWVAAATARSKGDTDTIDNNQWVYRSMVVQGIDGFEGTYTSYVYTVTDNPIKPKRAPDTSGSFNGSVETMPTSADGTVWWDTPSLAIANKNPLITGDEYVYESVCRYRQTTDGGLPNDPWEFLPFADGFKWSDPISNSLGGVYYEHQYATASDTFPTNDMPNDQSDKTYWRRSRVVSVTGSGTIYSSWSDPEKYHPAPVLGVDFLDGESGRFTSYIFRVSDGTPATPSGGSFNGSTEAIPDGWTDNPQYELYKRTWVSKAVYAETVSYAPYSRTWAKITNGTNPTGWTAPVQYLGEDGTDGMDGAYTSFVYKKTSDNLVVPYPPVKSTGRFTGNPDTEVMPNDVAGGTWVDEPPTKVAGEFIWVSQMKYIMVTDVHGEPDKYIQTRDGEWTTPKPYTGSDGLSAVPLMLTRVDVEGHDFSEEPPYGTEPNGRMTYYPRTHTLTGVPTGWKWGMANESIAEGARTFLSENVALFPAGQEQVAVKAEDWSNPIIIMKNGLTVNGYNQANVNLYKRISEGNGTLPPAPAGKFTYTFSTTTIVGGDLGINWFTKIPDPVPDGKGGFKKSVIYVAVASFVSRTDIDTVEEGVDEGWDVVEYIRDGNTDTEEYQYSALNAAPWHYGLTDGDYFRRTRSITKTPSGTVYGQWGVGVRIRQDGADGEHGIQRQTLIVYATVTKETPPPTRPSSSLTYVWGTGGVTPPNGLGSWSAIPPKNLGDMYWCLATVAAKADEVSTLIGAWGKPELLVSNGSNGKDGELGKHGQGSFRVKVNSINNIPSTVAGKDADVFRIAQRAAQDGDLINYFKNDGSAESQFSRFFFRDNGTWTESAFVVNGNAVIDGTLAATKLRAQTITGDKISAYSTIITGDGNNQAGMNGYDAGIYTNWRFWAGNVVPYSAPFKVNGQGAVFASNITISGGSLNIGNLFNVTSAGVVTIQSAASETESRLVINGDRLEVYEGTKLRVRLGRL